MQEGNLAAGGDGICDFMHGVGAQDNAFGPRLLQPDRGLSKDLLARSQSPADWQASMS